MTLAVLVRAYPAMLEPSVTVPLLWLCSFAGLWVMSVLLLRGWMKRVAVTFSALACVVVAGAVLPSAIYDCSWCWWCLECILFP